MYDNETTCPLINTAKSSWLGVKICVVVLIALSQSQTYVSLGLAQVSSPPITASGLGTHINPAAISPPGKVQYDITGGTRAGTNLFHSFGNFGVPNNNIANFLNESGASTSNILGRVTGGNPSNIFGTIQTTGFGSANLFLMNPAGFLFGPTATVNIGGMATFTTADYLPARRRKISFMLCPMRMRTLFSVRPRSQPSGFSVPILPRLRCKAVSLPLNLVKASRSLEEISRFRTERWTVGPFSLPSSRRRAGRSTLQASARREKF